MVATFSPHRDSGGTLHLPSPTHIHTADPSSTIAQLHRTLSRSPSKTPVLCVSGSKSRSPVQTSPLSPSPSSPNLRAAVGGSPLAVPFPRSARKGRSSVRRLSPMGAGQRPLSRQRSPAKRALSDCSDGGNATPSPPHNAGIGTENSQTELSKPITSTLLQPADQMIAEPTVTEHVANHPNRIFSRRDRHAAFGESSIKSSPLKRSDASCNLDLTRSGSPSAKRRSLHGSTFGADFDIFDQHAAMYSTHDGASDAPDQAPPSFASPMPRRNGSLRKAALHQRHEKPLRLRTGLEASSDTNTPNTNRNRTRISLDNFPQPARESPFSSQGSLPNASAHPLAPLRKDYPSIAPPVMSQRHPLSRTLTQSSSGSSFAEDSPTTISLRQTEARRANLDFARSLPLHASRPMPPPAPEMDSQPSSQEVPFATPENYKLAKPLPQAFMSTGLISKRNKNIEQDQLDAHESIGHMPDTPCKRPFSLATMSPVTGTGLSNGHPQNSRHTLHSFGTPSTPFNPHTSRNSVSFVANNTVFGSSFNAGPTRRGSFLAHDIVAESPAKPQTSQSSEISPTPRKHGEPAQPLVQPQPSNGTSGGDESQSQHEGNLNNRSFFESSSDEENEGSDGWDISMSPSARPRPHSLYAGRAEAQALEALSHIQSPTPHSRFFNTVPLARRRGGKPSTLPPGVPSPVFERPTHIQLPDPPTDILPPDPSRLSISVNTQSQGFFGANAPTMSSFFPPATPTTNRDSFHRTSHKSSLTPIQQVQAAQIDESITSRFDKVELIGLGEFSSVFRGIKVQGSLNQTGQGVSGRFTSLAPNQAWAVKKTRNAYLGRRDRKQKLKEVDILRELGRSEHTIEFVDSWEFGQHLYIQTEYCEEGGLDVFLEKVGRKARLDDFRIWKILLELSQGLKHIHDSGIIHLDLKPANILITFEGVLKIGDFGMATFWPAPAGIEGEGDREYIAPEILRGKFDKPADIFALGLIMLEIAGNVMLPDNGISWQRLRGGDMSDVPSLTSSSLGSQPSRDSSGCPVGDNPRNSDLESFFDLKDNAETPTARDATSWLQEVKTPTHRHVRTGELQDPPPFMSDSSHEHALDKLVQWMISPEPTDRPLAADLLTTVGVQWVQSRRRAGATIYEGNWGPADEVLQDDADMIDV